MLTPAKATCRRFSLEFPDAYASKSDLSPLFPRIPGCSRQQKQLVAAFPSNSRMLTPAKATCRRFSLEFPDAHASKSNLSPLFHRIPGFSRQQKQLVAAFPSDSRMLTPAKATCRRFSIGFPDFHASKSNLSPLFPRIPGCSRQQKQLVAAFPSDPRILTPAKATCRRFSLEFPDAHASKSNLSPLFHRIPGFSRQQKQLVAAFPSNSRMLTPAKATCRRFSIGSPDSHASKSNLSPLFPRIPGCSRQQKQLVAAFPSDSRIFTPAKATCRRFSLGFPDAHASKSNLSPLFHRIPGCSRQQKQLVAAFPSDSRMLTPAKATCRRFSIGFPDFHASKSNLSPLFPRIPGCSRQQKQLVAAFPSDSRM